MMKLKQAKEKKLFMERKKLTDKEIEDCTFNPKITELKNEIRNQARTSTNSKNRQNKNRMNTINKLEEPEYD